MIRVSNIRFSIRKIMNFIYYLFCIYLGEVIPKIKDATMTIQKFVETAKEATGATKHSKSLSKNRT